jgi:Na+-transporting NADH:ubiquinone oxidoreductase subunit C
MPDVNSKSGTLLVAFVLAVVCSVLVSYAAVSLKPLQDKNREMERQKNVLAAAGMLGENTDIDAAFENITVLAVNLKTGEFEEKAGFDTDYFKNFKQYSAARELTREQDRAGIASTAEVVPAYVVMKDGRADKIILPIYGSGLWSTMYGFLALEGDITTVAGLTFYDQKETPGLGGEVDNPNWKKLWPGKLAFDESGDVKLGLTQGKVDSSSPDAKYLVDSLSGASMTSRGVNNLVRFWLDDNGFGLFLKKIREEGLNG